jgi:hypothetical protein
LSSSKSARIQWTVILRLINAKDALVLQATNSRREAAAEHV